MKNYILIHGAWHGKWAFNKIVSNLNSAGLQAIALDLPGHYSNDVLKNWGSLTLQSYVNYVTDFIKANNLYNIFLLGHSMAGAVISQVGQNIPQNIAKLIYLAAFIPTPNGSVADEEKKAKFPSVALHITADKKNCSISIEKKDAKELFYNRCSSQDQSFALSKLQKQPLLPFVNSVSLGDNFAKLYKIYIECLQDKAIHIEDQRRMNAICDRIITIDSDHSPFFSAQKDLLLVLKEIAAL
jgi:pimeloyl-ACP methyl ester carboxylesterase